MNIIVLLIDKYIIDVVSNKNKSQINNTLNTKYMSKSKIKHIIVIVF